MWAIGKPFGFTIGVTGGAGQAAGGPLLSRMATLHVLVSFDRNFVRHAAVCLVSLAENNPGLSLDVVALSTDCPAPEVDRLRRSLSAYPQLALRYHDFSVEGRTWLSLTKDWTLDAYARFWVEDYFGTDVDRVLYLDVDTVVVAPLDELLTIEMGQNVVAGVSIPGATNPEYLKYPVEYGYFNSGVLLINLRQWREIGAREIVLGYCREHAHEGGTMDQDALNQRFHDQRLELDRVWNVISPFYWSAARRHGTEFAEVDEAEAARVRRGARVIHFNGVSKPWDYMSTHPERGAYARYLAKTEWRGTPPTGRSFMNRIKRLLRVVLG